MASDSLAAAMIPMVCSPLESSAEYWKLAMADGMVAVGSSSS